MKKVFGLLFFALWLFSCNRPDEQIPNQSQEEYIPKPYVLEYPSYFPAPFDTLAVKQMTVEGVQLGRMLFYDVRLSKNNTISCASCHRMDKAFSDPAPKSLGINGQQGLRNSMTLTNMAWVDRFFWDGRADNLENQVLIPIQDPIEMHSQLPDLVQKLNGIPEYGPMFKKAFGTSGIDTSRIAKALSQFLRSMVSSNSRYDKYLRGEINLSPQELLGRNLFYTHPVFTTNLRGGNCGDCHSGVLQTDHTFKNNGLDLVYQDNGLYNVTGNPAHIAKFRVPSLRNIALTAPYMHDGRFNTLQEVLLHYNEHVQRHPNVDPLMSGTNNPDPNSLELLLTSGERAAIIAFLHTLTDSTFISNPAFSNPNP
jgi:cytochrome c peroxidase